MRRFPSARRTYSPPIEELGSGTYGSVELHEDIPTKERVAKKTVTLFSKANGIRVDLIHEASILSTLEMAKLRNVAHLIDIRIVGKNCELYQQYAGKRIDMRKMGEGKIMGIIYNLLSTLSTIHSLGIIHGDIKNANIMLEGEKVSLIDFGLSQQAISTESLFKFMTTSYFPPETDITGYSDFSLDTWCLGLAIIMSLSSDSYLSILESVKENKWQADFREKKYSEDMINLVERMLTVNMQDRPMPQELVSGKLFRENYLINPPRLFTLKESLELRQHHPMPGDLEFRAKAVIEIYRLYDENKFTADIYFLAIKIMDVFLEFNKPFEELPSIVYVLAVKLKADDFRGRDKISRIVVTDKWNELELQVFEACHFNINYSTVYDYRQLVPDYDLNYMLAFVRSDLVFKLTDFELISLTAEQLTPEHQELFDSLAIEDEDE